MPCAATRHARAARPRRRIGSNLSQALQISPGCASFGFSKRQATSIAPRGGAWFISSRAPCWSAGVVTTTRAADRFIGRHRFVSSSAVDRFCPCFALIKVKEPMRWAIFIRAYAAQSWSPSRRQSIGTSVARSASVTARLVLAIEQVAQQRLPAFLWTHLWSWTEGVAFADILASSAGQSRSAIRFLPTLGLGSGPYGWSGELNHASHFEQTGVARAVLLVTLHRHY